ncbi:MAG: hypothetical protein ACXVA9_10340 [Bdellovibrionales bacterium]
MLKKVFKKLDTWIEEVNANRAAAGSSLLAKVEIRVIGQTALLEANLSLEIAATMDVDLIDQIEHTVKEKFAELLREQGKVLDPVDHEAWMPTETEYVEIFAGRWLSGFLARPVFIILSKAKYAPEKNGNLIAEYLASGDLDDRIFELAEKYKVDLDKFV